MLKKVRNSRMARRMLALAFALLLVAAIKADEVTHRENSFLILDDKSFDTALIDYPKLAVFFSDSSCGKCDDFRPVWEQLSKEYTSISSEVVLAQMNLSKNPVTQKKYGVC